MLGIDEDIEKRAALLTSRCKFHGRLRDELAGSVYQRDLHQGIMLTITAKTCLTSTCCACTYDPFSVGLASRLHDGYQPEKLCYMKRHVPICQLQQEGQRQGRKRSVLDVLTVDVARHQRMDVFRYLQKWKFLCRIQRCWMLRQRCMKLMTLLRNMNCLLPSTSKFIRHKRAVSAAYSPLLIWS